MQSHEVYHKKYTWRGQVPMNANSDFSIKQQKDVEIIQLLIRVDQSEELQV
jgi:hypothetical protein